MSNVIVFDLDGVITSEEAYWTTAGLVLHELLYSPRYWHCGAAPTPYIPPTSWEDCFRLSHEVLPEPVIVSLKSRSINSNWDTCYVAVSLNFIQLLALLPERASLFPLRPWETGWTKAFRQALAQISTDTYNTSKAYHALDIPPLQHDQGLELIGRLNVYASELLGQPVEGIFARYSPMWTFCQDLFQEWYLGEELYTREYGHAPAQGGKHGCIYFEQPLLPVEQLRTTLATLRERSYCLGVATGRPGEEAILPLKNYGLFEYFDEQRVKTHADVALAEAALRRQGETISLVKPHPYQFLVAADPHYQPGQPVPLRGSFVVVGDTPSDVRGAQAAGAIMIAVLTGARTPQARTALEQSAPDFIIEDVTQVPALLEQIDDLATIQRLQFSERTKAEVLLQRWFARHMNVWAEQVILMPKAVSLNSFNGIYRVNGEEFFFKTHVEEKGILEEYYHAELLARAGYNVVRPLRTVHEKGQQMVIYPVVHDPVMFDLMRAVETGDTTQASVELLAAAEQRECARLLSIYQETLQSSTAEEHAQAPIHQLFWHRLTGGRLAHFYAGKHFPLPGQAQHASSKKGLSFEELLGYDWIINGTAVAGDMPTLGALIEQATQVLHPARAGMTVIGHGDAHFGNVFLEDRQTYRYFDPAFAGRHTPILDIVKPFFHNIWATWMYFPTEVLRDLRLTVEVRDHTIVVEHNYRLTPVRQAIWDTKVEYLLRPLIALLRARQALPADWFQLFRLALMCCPLLTINLLDETRRPAEICWLGLSQVLQMGNLANSGEEDI